MIGSLSLLAKVPLVLNLVLLQANFNPIASVVAIGNNQAFWIIDPIMRNPAKIVLPSDMRGRLDIDEVEVGHFSAKSGQTGRCLGARCSAATAKMDNIRLSRHQKRAQVDHPIRAGPQNALRGRLGPHQGVSQAGQKRQEEKPQGSTRPPSTRYPRSPKEND